MSAQALALVLAAPACEDSDSAAVCGASNDADLSRRLSEAEAALANAEKANGKLGEVPGHLDLEVEFAVGDTPLELETDYVVESGTVRFDSVRYWLSNVALANADGEVHVENSYYLMEIRKKYIDSDDSGNPIYEYRRREKVSVSDVPAGKYSKLVFYVGVDATHNDDLSLPGGELNVLSSMAVAGWMWFTSYLFTSATGEFTPNNAARGAPPVMFFWDNGTNEDYRRVEFSLDHELTVGFAHNPKVSLALDASRLLNGLAGKVEEDAKSNPEAPASFIGPTDKEPRATLTNNWQSAFVLRKVVSDAP